MTLKLYAHPFSSYSQKALIALYENGTPFDYRMLGPDEEQNAAEHVALWPLKRFPMLVDGDKPVMEASIIIEYLDLNHPGPVKLIPEDPRAAMDVRFMDRFFDNYVMTPMQKIVFDYLRPPGNRNPQDIADARKALDESYAWLNNRMKGREWAAGNFSLADCAAAPSLFYADWVQPIAENWPNLRAYRQRLLARPSFARAVNEARPYRSFFPPGAPDRD